MTLFLVWLLALLVLLTFAYMALLIAYVSTGSPRCERLVLLRDLRGVSWSRGLG